jgi:hypothetical protein
VTLEPISDDWGGSLFALPLLVFSDAFITNLVVAGKVFRRNEIAGRPLRTIRAEVPSIGAGVPPVFRCHKTILIRVTRKKGGFGHKSLLFTGLARPS